MLRYDNNCIWRYTGAASSRWGAMRLLILRKNNNMLKLFILQNKLKTIHIESDLKI